MSNVPIPNVPTTVDPQTRMFLEKVKEALETRLGSRGNRMGRVPTWQDLVDLGLIQAGAGGRVRVGDFVLSPPGTEYNPYDDHTQPPAPQGLTIAASPNFLMLQWTGHSRNTSLTEVWRSELDDLDSAEFIGTSAGGMYADSVGPAAGFYYWVRFKSYTGVYGPWNGFEGTFGETGESPSDILDQLDGGIRESHLHESLTERINLIDGPEFGLVDRLAAETADRIQAVLDEAQARTAALLQEAADRTAAIQHESTIRASGDEALAAEISGLAAQVHTDVDSLTAAIHAEASARVDADEALAYEMSLIIGEIAGDDGTLTGLITEERQARIAGDEALASDLTLLVGRVDTEVEDLEAAILQESSARANAISAVASDLTALSANVGSEVSDLGAAIQQEATVRADADSALASDITALESQVSTDLGLVSAAIQAEVATRATEVAAVASNVSALGVRMSDAEGDISAAASAVSTVQTTVSGHGDQLTAHAQAISQLEASSGGGDTAAIQELQEIVLGPDGLSAQWTVKTDVNGYVSGFGLYNDGDVSDFIVHADRFAVGAPGATPYSLLIEDGRVVIDGAAIKNLSVTDAAIAEVNVDKITGAVGNFIQANIGEGSITNALIGDTIQSDNYVPGVSGWILKK